MATGDAFGADLNAGVDETGGGVAGEFDLEMEDEVGVGGGGADEVVVGDLLASIATGEDAVFEAPNGTGKDIPSRGGFSVEEGLGGGGDDGCGFGSRKGGRQEAERCGEEER